MNPIDASRTIMSQGRSFKQKERSRFIWDCWLLHWDFLTNESKCCSECGLDSIQFKVE